MFEVSQYGALATRVVRCIFYFIDALCALHNVHFCAHAPVYSGSNKEEIRIIRENGECTVCENDHCFDLGKCDSSIRKSLI